MIRARFSKSKDNDQPRTSTLFLVNLKDSLYSELNNKY